MIKKINLLALIFMLMILTACGKGGNNGEGKKESNEFRVGMECGYAPFNWFQSDDSNGAVKNSSNG